MVGSYDDEPDLLPDFFLSGFILDLIHVRNPALRYHELRGYLEKHGHVFKTHSDTEVILHLYEEFGRQRNTHVFDGHV